MSREDNAQRFLEEFKDLPPMSMAEGMIWIRLYIRWYMAEPGLDPLTTLLRMKKEVLRAHQLYLDREGLRARQAAYAVATVLAAAGGLLFSVFRFAPSMS